MDTDSTDASPLLLFPQPAKLLSSNSAAKSSAIFFMVISPLISLSFAQTAPCAAGLSLYRTAMGRKMFPPSPNGGENEH